MVSLLATHAYFVKKLTLVDQEYTNAAVKGQGKNCYYFPFDLTFTMVGFIFINYHQEAFHVSMFSILLDANVAKESWREKIPLSIKQITLLSLGHTEYFVTRTSNHWQSRNIVQNATLNSTLNPGILKQRFRQRYDMVHNTFLFTLF